MVKIAIVRAKEIQLENFYKRFLKNDRNTRILFIVYGNYL